MNTSIIHCDPSSTEGDVKTLEHLQQVVPRVHEVDTTGDVHRTSSKPMVCHCDGTAYQICISAKKSRQQH